VRNDKRSHTTAAFTLSALNPLASPPPIQLPLLDVFLNMCIRVYGRGVVCA